MGRVSLDNFLKNSVKLQQQILNELKLINIELKNINRNIVMVSNELMRLK